MESTRRFALFFVSLVILTLALGACQTKYAFRGTAVDPPTAAPDFTLVDAHGKPFQLGAQQGKVVLLYFGYTHCPDVCPLTLANLAQVRRALGPEAERVQVVFVTSDPERDTAAVLVKYLAEFDPSFVGLRGESSEISPILQKYFASATKQESVSSTSGYKVDHTAYVYGIDRKQQWRVLFSPDTKIDDIVSDVRYLLGES